ncbi:hypothetical protein B0T24DRAFT_514977 [Lasiosphaeria ovina]|uniref:Uncharacterized protein n=1 Tax=Lasiosphaeria ovina TaxID=92902 RepID=A0AAE0NJ24_9PEZI|nr:hypothetical protein B0T24DRAFT_514977 [Lasiosphaeria ovina]
MPPTLDLSRTSHSKMIISPPRINLRRAASYNHDRGPISSTSSRFSFNHLVFSPPPSPGLPSLSPPPPPKPRGLTGLARPSRIARLVVRLLALLLILYAAAAAVRLASPVIPWPSQSPAKPEALEHENLPDFPTPILVTDKRGRTKWTVSIPSSYEFPLTRREYSDMCEKCREVSERAHSHRSHGSSPPQTYLGFGSVSADHDFIDVKEAEKAGYLPNSAVRDRANEGGAAGKPVCDKSLTFVLESADAGIGTALLMLWTAYGLAQKEGRAFFIDDTRWAYGKYADIFQPPPSPECLAPPKHEILPCPRQAKHLVASAATAHVLFGTPTTDSDATPSGLLDSSARKVEFELARRGHEALFKLNKEDGDYIDTRLQELMARRIVPKARGTQNGLAIGIHVRRGDRHPLEYQYRHSYMPLHIYADTARDFIDGKLDHTGPHGAEDKIAKQHSFIVLASDDPMVHVSSEFAGSRPAQERIRLASKEAIQKANPPNRQVIRKFVDETFGWEGGFFAAMFWNLGQRQQQPPQASPPPPSSESLRLRGLVARAYMMDLAVLADGTDAVICTASAAGCCLLAVMMGWESAFDQGNWINIDGGGGWVGASSSF